VNVLLSFQNETEISQTITQNNKQIMKVFKFGGASIKDAASIRNVVQIIKKYGTDYPLVVVSASGKTTNALERVVKAYVEKSEDLTEALNVVKKHHQDLLDDLFQDQMDHPIFDEVNDLFIDLEWILEEEPQDEYDYLYDQIVSTGELLSTTIVAAYLNKEGVKTHWLDVRDCILTDNTHRDANVDWEATEERILNKVPKLRESGIVLTQGFLGVTTENFTTTLGREGSDYTAAIFSYCLEAESMSIWKDVPGVLTGDPRVFDDVVLMEKISYQEAIEMTYYGAQVIHPKTLRPLQNKQIPMYVRSFVHPEGTGTVVSSEKVTDYPPVIVLKKGQALLKIVSKSFYFVDEERFSRLFASFARHRIKVNMTQNTALAFSVCINYDERKLQALLAELEEEYKVDIISDLKLITIRHTTPAMLDRFAKGRKLYLEERIRNTSQLVMHEEEPIV
jgi:aspartate kinase